MKFKVNTKIYLIIIAIILFAIVYPSNCFAMTSTFPNNAKYSRGVSNTCYYVSSSASGYTSQISQAAHNWVVTGYGWNPIQMTAVSSNKGTHMDIYASDFRNVTNISDNTNAYTTFWTSSSQLVSQPQLDPTYNYFYTEIHINTYRTTMNVPTLIHEMGHCFGLAHSTSEYSIMYPYSSRLVTTVQKDDHDTINYLYN